MAVSGAALRRGVSARVTVLATDEQTRGTFDVQESFGTLHVRLLTDGVEQEQAGLLLLTRFAIPRLSMLARASEADERAAFSHPRLIRAVLRAGLGHVSPVQDCLCSSIAREFCREAICTRVSFEVAGHTVT